MGRKQRQRILGRMFLHLLSPDRTNRRSPLLIGEINRVLLIEGVDFFVQFARLGGKLVDFAPETTKTTFK